MVVGDSRKGWVLIPLSTLFLNFSCGKKGSLPERESPSTFVDSSMYQADPTVFFNNDTFYLYGTNDVDPDIGIKVFTSTNLEVWKSPSSIAGGLALRREESFGQAGFWAPQVFQYNSKFYMAYVADKQIAIASSNSPLGPFFVANPINMGAQSIDPFVFMDTDGKKYLFFDDISNGNKIYVAQINDGLTALTDGNKTLCLTATELWETIQDRVVEGPTIIKHDGYYYLIYSANNFVNPHYAVGYATSKSILGPWQKFGNNPILSIDNIGKPGSGHGDIFYGTNNQMYYVFHTHNSGSKVTPRRTAIVKAHFTPNNGGPDFLIFDTNSFYYLKETN